MRCCAAHGRHALPASGIAYKFHFYRFPHKKLPGFFSLSDEAAPLPAPSVSLRWIARRQQVLALVVLAYWILACVMVKTTHHRVALRPCFSSHELHSANLSDFCVSSDEGFPSTSTADRRGASAAAAVALPLKIQRQQSLVLAGWPRFRLLALCVAYRSLLSVSQSCSPSSFA